MTADAKGRQRRLVRRLLALLAVFALVAAACGDDDDANATDGDTNQPTATTAPDDGDAGDDGDATPTEEPDDGIPDDLDPEGELLLATDMTQWFGTGFDPSTANGPGNFFSEMIYGTLLRRTGDGQFHSSLASIEDGTGIVDPSTIKIVLYPGQTFTNGEALDAQAVADVIARAVMFGNTRSNRAGQLGALKHSAPTEENPRATELDEGGIEVVDDTTVVLNLNQPIAGAWLDLLAHEETMPYFIPDVQDDPDTENNELSDAIQADPVGAGPFMLEPGSFKENNSFRLVPNPGYIHADQIHIAAVQINHVTSDASITALNAGDVDWSPSGITTAEQVNRDGYSFLAIPNEDNFGWLWTACMGSVFTGAATQPRTLENGDPHPLTKVAIRQALNYGTDKEAMIEEALAGLLENGIDVPVMDQIWANDDPRANPELVGSYPFDQAKALELLATEGYGPDNPLEVTMVVNSAPTTATFNVLQRQWAEIGVNLTPINSPNAVTDFYAGRSIDFAGNAGGSSARFFTDKITRNWRFTEVGATCQPDKVEVGGDPSFEENVVALMGLSPDDPATIPLWQVIAAQIIEPAFGVFLTQPPSVVTVNDAKLGIFETGAGFSGATSELWPTQVGIFYPDVHQVYIRQ